VPDYALVMGNPAKVVGWVCECGNRIVFHEGDSNGICKECRKVYSKRNAGVTLANLPTKPPAEQKVRVIP
ncbi:MAG: hypothetical protein DRG35_03395, partial [Deltaproteobacteria bacterium]